MHSALRNLNRFDGNLFAALDMLRRDCAHAMLEEPDNSNTTTANPGLRDILALLADGRSQVRVGDITLDENGQLCIHQGGGPIRFCFAYKGVDFNALMDTAADASISLAAELGKMPFSMETGVRRGLTRRIVDATADLPGGSIELSDSHDMSIVAKARPPLPLTPASIMATIAALLLDLAPYIDLLRRVIDVANVPPIPAPAATSSDRA